MMKLVTLFVLLVCTVVGARSCSASSPSSPFNPANVARNGLSGACANQQAVEDAGGGSSAGGSLPIPQAVQQELGNLAGTPVSCPTTTTSASGN